MKKKLSLLCFFSWSKTVFFRLVIIVSILGRSFEAIRCRATRQKRTTCSQRVLSCVMHSPIREMEMCSRSSSTLATSIQKHTHKHDAATCPALVKKGQSNMCVLLYRESIIQYNLIKNMGFARLFVKKKKFNSKARKLTTKSRNCA